MSRDTEKKRKRKDDGEKPRKKRATETRDAHVKITYTPVSDESGLVVANGPGLSGPSAIKFQAYRKQNHDARSHTQHDELLVRSSDHPKLNFTGREREEGAPASQLKHYVGVFDPVTNELQLIEARHVDLRATVKEEDYAMVAQQTKSEDVGAAARRGLGLEFGTKKAQKAIAQNADNRISAAKRKPGKKGSAAEAVLSILDDYANDAPSKEEMQAETEAGKPRPKYNLKAKRAEDAYTVDGVIGEDLMMKLKVKAWWDAVRNDEDVQLPSRYVSRRLNNLVENDDIRKLKITKYILVLIKFLDTCTFKGKPQKRIPKREILRDKVGEPDNVLDKVVERFSQNGTFTPWYVDLVRTTLAVLTLIVDDFETDTHDLREDIGLKAPEMNKYFAEVGARVKPPTEEQLKRFKLSKTETSVHGIATLKIPLEFPKPRTIPNRR